MRSFFDGLLRCDDCLHAIADHINSKCASDGCECLSTRDDIINANVMRARQDIADGYKRARQTIGEA